VNSYRVTLYVQGIAASGTAAYVVSAADEEEATLKACKAARRDFLHVTRVVACTSPDVTPWKDLANADEGVGKA